MIFPHATPILGIVSEQDPPRAGMLAIVIKGKDNGLLWSYVRERVEGNLWIPLDAPLLFTPLKHFCCSAWFTPAGKLAITQHARQTRARYANGHMRDWQGAQQEAISVHPDIVRHVHEVLAAEAAAKSHSRREARVG